MLKKEEFTKKWKSEHFPTQELEFELLFYYNVYQKIYEVASQSVKKIDDFLHHPTIDAYRECGASSVRFGIWQNIS